jgi:hypothetical protein
LALAAFTATGTAQAQAQASDYPNKPIKFVVSSPSGGVVDIRARRFGVRLSELLKQPIIVENRPPTHRRLHPGTRHRRPGLAELRQSDARHAASPPHRHLASFSLTRACQHRLAPRV